MLSEPRTIIVKPSGLIIIRSLLTSSGGSECMYFFPSLFVCCMRPWLLNRLGLLCENTVKKAEKQKLKFSTKHPTFILQPEIIPSLIRQNSIGIMNFEVRYLGKNSLG